MKRHATVTRVSDTAAAVPRATRSRRRIYVIAAIVVLALAVAAWAYFHYEPSISSERLLDLFGRYGYFVIFVPVLLETAGLPLPGETTLLLSGVAASTGRIDPWIAIAVGSVAAILGDNIGYAIGRYGGRRLVMRLAHVGRIESSLAWGEQFFARHGGKTVFFARWIFGLRIFGAWIAGMVHMPWRVFFFYNAAGGITWCASVIGLGYFFGHSLHAIEKLLGVGGVIAVVSVAIIGLVTWRRFERSKLHQLETEGEDAPPAPPPAPPAPAP
jgi:membrane protein DedA with SNARE-associated domain